MNPVSSAQLFEQQCVPCQKIARKIFAATKKHAKNIEFDTVVLSRVATYTKRQWTIAIGEDGNFLRGGAGHQFSPRRGHDFST